MNVVVLAIDSENLTVQLIHADPADGTTFCKVAVVVAIADDLPTPYLGNLANDEVKHNGTASSATARLGAKARNEIVATPIDHSAAIVLALDKLESGLTRSIASILEGDCFIAQPTGAEPYLLWKRDLRLSDVLAAERTRLSQKKADHGSEVERLRAAAAVLASRERSSSNDRFINPYTFVPFPSDEPVGFRTAPAGHHELAPGRFCGWMNVEIRTATPLLTRDNQGKFPRTPDGRPMVSGSSIKGALRSLHETMAGGCLRVLDTQFVPVYRDVAKVQSSAWRMAVVESVQGDMPTTFQLCDAQVAWTSAAELHRAVPPATLKTGTRVSIAALQSGNHDRLNGTGIAQGGDWVVLITDAAARAQKHPYYAALGHLTPQRADIKDEAVWARYLRVVNGARDLQKSSAPSAVVQWEREAIGSRQLAGRKFSVGDVLWVKLEGGGVTDLKLSYLWRSEGEQSMSERTPSWMHACSDSESLCPTCRLFGSAEETTTQADEKADQQSYRGHLRFTDASTIARVQTEMVDDLAPLGQPRPGAGQFYLTMSPKERAARRDERPTREWGARPDHAPRPDDKPRQVNGRKFYWTADPSKQHPRRDRRGPAQVNEKMGGQAEILPPGTTLTTCITFENLSAAEIGGVLAILQPQRVLEKVAPEGFSEADKVFHVRLGGAKPFGYGSVDVTITELVVHNAASRYLGEDPPSISLEALVDAFAESVPSQITAIWPDLAAVLSDGHVNPARVAYPPGRPWPEELAAEPEKFRDPFQFFKNSSGESLRRDEEETSLSVLPGPPRNVEQTLPIERAKP